MKPVQTADDMAQRLFYFTLVSVLLLIVLTVLLTAM